MNKKALSEPDICDRYITPAIEHAGRTSDKWRRKFSFTDGKMIARSKPRRAHYLLFHTPNRPIAVIEAKDNKHSVTAVRRGALLGSTWRNVDLDATRDRPRPAHDRSAADVGDGCSSNSR